MDVCISKKIGLRAFFLFVLSLVFSVGLRPAGGNSQLQAIESLIVQKLNKIKTRLQHPAAQGAVQEKMYFPQFVEQVEVLKAKFLGVGYLKRAACFATGAKIFENEVSKKLEEISSIFSTKVLHSLNPFINQEDWVGLLGLLVLRTTVISKTSYNPWIAKPLGWVGCGLNYVWGKTYPRLLTLSVLGFANMIATGSFYGFVQPFLAVKHVIASLLAPKKNTLSDKIVGFVTGGNGPSTIKNWAFVFLLLYFS